MSEVDELQQHLVALESHIAHQDSSIEDLHEMVNRQWVEIETLQKRLRELQDRLARLELEIEPPEADDQPPPHY